MIRPGHHRPLGTTTWMRFPDWPRDRRRPQLLDVIVQTDGPGGDPDEVERAYEVFGVFETKTGYRLHCERIPYGQFPASRDPDAYWAFHNVPRRPPLAC
jgi:hypothetical protein